MNEKLHNISVVLTLVAFGASIVAVVTHNMTNAIYCLLIAVFAKPTK